MKKFKAMFAATAAVMALSAVSVPMSAFAEELPSIPHPNTQTYTYDLGEVVEPGAEGKHDTWDEAYDDQQGVPTPQANVNVDFSIAPAYTVTIPADVKIDTNSRQNANEVHVENVFLNKGKAVEVSVASKNAYNMLLNATDTVNTIPYSLKGIFNVGTGGGSVEIVNREQPNSDVPGAGVFKPIITVPTGSKIEPGMGNALLIYSISRDQDIPVAGTYSDRLTFQIKVVDVTTNGTGEQGDGDGESDPHAHDEP